MIEPLESLRKAVPVIRHHEHYDGSGYPDGLEGEEIPLTARIVAATDAYDAMVRSRPYRERRSPTEAIGNSGEEREASSIRRLWRFWRA